MTRTFAALPAALVLVVLAGCGGPAKLAQHSEEKLQKGQSWQAWTLATRALDKAPGNPRAQAAATAAASAIAADWQRRIQALTATDSLEAAEQVLKFVDFRTDAARYTTVHVDAGWTTKERALRASAARGHYAAGGADLKSQRPKSAWRHFTECMRFAPDYRDAATLADRALADGQTRLAIAPFASGMRTLGRDVAASWRGDVVERMAPPGSQFTRVLATEDVERTLRVPELRRMTREDAIRAGRRAGADRVVWGTVGEPVAKTGFQVFADRVARRVVEKDEAGRTVERWAQVPIEVVSRVRTVDVRVEYEVIATSDGTTLSRHGDTRHIQARAVWTSYVPEGDVGAYALYTEEARAADPAHCREVETRWRSVVGEAATLAQVLDARRASARQPSDRRGQIGRIAAGAAFVMMEDLPETSELAFATLTAGWQPLVQDLLRLDGMDDADLGVATASAGDR
jgi:hypothetical protein